MLKHLPKLLTALLLLGLYFERQSQSPPVDAAAFHAAVRVAVDSIPNTLGDWEGTDVPVPTAAQALLRPNAIFARAYYSPARRTRATLLIVQCRDPRDMTGHYPPVCYPAHGWTAVGEPAPMTVQVGPDESLPVTRYDFVQAGFSRRKEMVIYGFFVLPMKGPVSEMGQVQRASGDYRTRGLGAAQVQVLMEPGLTAREEAGIFQELISPLMPTIRLLGGGEAGA